MRRHIAWIALIAVASGLVGCAPVGAGSAAAAPPGSTSAAPSTRPTAGPSADPQLAWIDAAEAAWAANRPETYAYTVTFVGQPGLGSDRRYRVVTIDGHEQVVGIEGLTDPTEAQAATIEAIFNGARAAAKAGRIVHLELDPRLGYPSRFTSDSAMASDSDSGAMTVSARTTPSDGAAASTRAALAEARAQWTRWRPTAFAYDWYRWSGGGASSSGTGWHVMVDGDLVATSASPSSDGAYPLSDATIEATLDAADAALDAGRWVDLSVDRTLGVPILVAVDTTPDGPEGASWTRIDFTDTARATARRDLQAARERWASHGSGHSTYTWRFAGDGRDLAYDVVAEGEVLELHRHPGTPLPEANAVAAPRITDTFAMLEQVLAQGGTVEATYDETYGYPRRAVMDPAGDVGARGTITVTDFTT